MRNMLLSTSAIGGTILGLVTAVDASLATPRDSAYPDAFDPSKYATDCILQTDIAVIGGGSSGTYAAINLRLQGQNVVVIETEPALGGQVNTYHDPSTGISIDYGVQEFLNTSHVRDFFAHFNVSLITPKAPSGSVTTHYADFRTGEQILVTAGTNFTPYIDQLDKYPYLEGAWNLPYPVPEDLVLPFGDFIKKYNLQELAYTIYFSSQGVADILNQITALVFKAVDQTFVGILQGGGVATANHDTLQAFQLAQAELGRDALLSSAVIATQRPNEHGGVSLVVQTPEGMKLIMASKLLLTMPPLLSNMVAFDLDQNEHDLFAQWNYSAYYTMLVNNTGLVTGGRYANAVSNTSTYNIPALPAAYQVTETAIPGLYYVWYASPYPLGTDTIQANVTSVIQRLRVTENSTSSDTPNFVAFRSHTPYRLSVSAEAIENGFYRDLNALQGYRNTWYTGAAITSTGSTGLWEFTSSIIQQIIAA